MPVSIRSKRKGRTFALEGLTGKSTDAPRLSYGMGAIASPAAASCAVRYCWSAAIPASANRRC
jgi:hypothetical protein